MSPKVVLIGPMGVGKSTIASLLAARWGVAVRDTDADIVAAEGREISEIFVDSGEDYFRAKEREAVAVALAEHDGVLALGGGAVLAQATRELLATHRVVFLNVGLHEAVKRVGLGVGRPLLLGNVRSKLKATLDERAPLYSATAGFTLDTTGLTPDEVADRVATWVEQQEAAQEAER